ncbi:MAG: NAD(P)H-dependent oxidoreductase subunit E [Chloroflexota bacterium]|nr:NAD(P)H-dependent oxidoreductase subunit E [Chloroflexota bacterium]
MGRQARVMDGLKQRIKKAVQNQPQPTVTILSSLLAVEDELGYIPREAVEEVATFNQATINDVWAVVSFYPNFRTVPPCEHRIEVCWGPSCHLVGAMPVIASVLEAAGMEDEGDTPDGKLTIRYNTCLGACALAPVMSVDHRLAGRITPEKGRELVSKTLDSASGGEA